MKTLYFDTTYLFRVYSTEPGHQAVKNLLAGSGSFAIACHGRAEFASMILRKRREGNDSDADLYALDAQFQKDCEGGLIELLSVPEAVMHRLETTLRAAPASTNLRAADALNLACAAEHGFSKVHSNDRNFLAAASLFGLESVNVIPTS